MSGTWVWRMSWGLQPEIVEAGMLSSINAEKLGQKLRRLSTEKAINKKYNNNNHNKTRQS